jgi:hypothetical protein
MKNAPRHPKYHHDALAPYWAATLVILGATGLSTNWLDLGDFWNGYVLDMTGPAWNYILFRGLFRSKTDHAWTRFFRPTTTLLIFLAVCTGIEMLQYQGCYAATFDPWDFVAYVSLLLPIYLIDRNLNGQAS